MKPLSLLPHPTTPCDFVRSLQVQPRAHAAGLQLSYVVAGDVQRIVVPESRRPARTDGLWRATCFEIFLRPAAALAYQEFNFSPSGEWAAYSFDDYRCGMTPLDQPQPPHIACTRTPERLQVDVLLHSPWLAEASLSAAMTSVLQHADGRFSYWSLAHPPAKPDFHDAAGFVAQNLGAA